MPQINLLISATEKRHRKSSIEKIREVDTSELSKKILPISLIVLSVVIVAWVVLGVLVSQKRNALKLLEMKAKNFNAQPQELTRMRESKEKIQKKVSYMEDLLFRKFLWTDKFRDITNVIPDGVWLTEISLEKRRLKSKGPEFDQTSLLPVLLIKGKAVSYEIQGAIDLIGKFNVLLKENDSFFRDFSDVELRSISKGAIGRADVMSFEFYCPIK